MTFLPPMYQLVLIVVVLIAAAFDVRTRRIPNWLVLTAILIGVALNTFLFGLSGLSTSLFGGAAAFAVYFPLFALRGMGAGDVKLMVGIGCIVGPSNWLAIFSLTAILGGLFAIFMLLQTGRLMYTLMNVWFIFTQVIQLKAPFIERSDLDINDAHAIRLPHGATIAVGSLAFLFGPTLLRF